MSKADEPHLYHRHIVDCLAIAPLMPPGFSSGIDLGSGGGFPGLILAIATGRPFTLVESDHRKSAFLREAARITQAPVTVVTGRIETLALGSAPVVTARALASLSVLLGWIEPLLAKGGVAILPKGRAVDRELTEAARKWQMQVERFPSATDATATILRIREIRRVGRAE